MRAGISVVAVVIIVVTSGCDCFFDQEVELPLDLTSPPQEIDVDPAVAEAEGSACAADDSPSCLALKAICRTDAAAECDANPSMPAEFPVQVEVVPNEPPVDANELMVTMGITEATELEAALPVDVAAALADKGVQTPEAIENVRIDNVVVQWPENSLTFDTPPLDLYVSPEDLGAGSLDAEALIAAGTVTKVGTIGLDLDEDGTIDVGQVAGSTGDVALVFVDGGRETLSTAVTGASFTVVTAVQDGNGLQLKTKPGDESTALKPGGAATMQLKATLVYVVRASDIVGAVPTP